MMRAACLGPAEPHAQLTTKQGAGQLDTGGPTLAQAQPGGEDWAAMPLGMGSPPPWTSLSLGVKRRHRHPFLSSTEPGMVGQLRIGYGSVDREG